MGWHWFSALFAAGFLLILCICIGFTALIYHECHKKQHQWNKGNINGKCHASRGCDVYQNSDHQLHSQSLDQHLRSTQQVILKMLYEQQGKSCDVDAISPSWNNPPHPALVRSLHQTYANDTVLAMQDKLEAVMERNSDLAGSLSRVLRSREKSKKEVSELQRKLKVDVQTFDGDESTTFGICPEVEQISSAEIQGKGSNWRDRLKRIERIENRANERKDLERYH